MTTDSGTKRSWTLELQFEGYAEKLSIPVDHEVILGRRDRDSQEPNLIDLNPYNADEKGVSRLHAVLRWQSGILAIIDQKSANGTLLNGLRLEPETAYRISDGDQLHLGHLKCKVHLNDMFTQTTVQAQRIDLDNRLVPAAGRGQRILIVEDDPGLSELYRIALERASFTTTVTRDVISAMKLLHQTTPALIVLDLMLPGVQGLELARYIRRDSNGPAIPIIVSSAITDTNTIKAAMADGVDVYLTKPPNLKEMVRIVSQVIDRNERANPAMHTKQLKATASLENIASAPRNDTIVIFVEDRREPIAAVVHPQLTFGRTVTGAQSRKHVDLEEYQAFDKGVSRIHARLTRSGDGFTIQDEDSINGTYVNGTSLNPHQEYPIHNGDELRLGKLKLRLYMLGDTKGLDPVGTITSSKRGTDKPEKK